MGLWLLLAGEGSVQWIRPAMPDGVAVRLGRGLSLVAVAADGGVSSMSRAADNANDDCIAIVV